MKFESAILFLIILSLFGIFASFAGAAVNTTIADDDSVDGLYSSLSAYYNATGDYDSEDILAALDNQYCDMTIRTLIRTNRELYRAIPGHPTQVNLSVIITNSGGLSDRDQQISLSVFIDFRWTDPRFRLVFKQSGDSCSVENQTFVTDNMMDIWFPLFTIDNSADKLLYPDAWEKFPGIIYPNGTVWWRSSFRLRLNCDINLAVFPYDRQNCHLMVRSPNYQLDDLIYNVDKERIVVFWDDQANSDPLWDITGQSHLLTTGVPGVNIRFRFERKSSFYTWTLVLPTFVISVLTSLTFILPPDHSEKMTTMLTGVLAYFLLLLALTSITPIVSENMPALAIFFVSTIGVGVGGAVATAFIQRLCDHLARAAKSKAKHHSVKQKQPPVFSCSISPALVNNLCLVVFVAATVACYAAYFAYVLNQSPSGTTAKFDYLPVLMYGQ